MDLTEPEAQKKTVEDQIFELEALLKSVKAVKDSDRGKAYAEDMEADLKNLREQQKRARPLPARLQAATARKEKTKAAFEEATKKAETLKEQMATAEKEVLEAMAKDAEADVELQAVKELAAVGSAVGSTHLAAQLLQFLVEALGLDEQTKEALAAQAQAAFQGWPQVAPQPPGFGQHAAAAVQSAAVQAAAAVQQATEAAATAALHQATAADAAAKATAAIQNQAAVQAKAEQHQLALAGAAAVPPPRALPVRQALPGRAAPGTPVGGLLEGASGARDRSKTPPSMQRNSIGC